MREFDTGATRDSDENKLDYEGFFNPFVLQRYAEYMHKHRKQADGKMRASDNWQKGMPREVYMKSLLRHVFEVWQLHRCEPYDLEEIVERLCATVFNAFGYIHQIIEGSLHLSPPVQIPKGKEQCCDAGQCDDCNKQEPF